MASRISAVDGVDGLEHALAADSASCRRRAARPPRARRSRRRRAPRRGRSEPSSRSHVDLDRRVAAAVEDLAGDDVDDRGHGELLRRWRRGTARCGLRSCAGLLTETRRQRRQGASRRVESASSGSLRTGDADHDAEPPSTTLQLGQPSALARNPRGGPARPGAEPASRHGLPRALHGARVHLALPGDRPAGFRHPGDRLRARTVARRIEVAEALSRTRSATTAPSTRIARSASASGSSSCSSPRWLRIGGYWYPRGGIPIDVFWQTGELPQNLWLPDQGVAPYRARG